MRILIHKYKLEVVREYRESMHWRAPLTHNVEVTGAEPALSAERPVDRRVGRLGQEEAEMSFLKRKATVAQKLSRIAVELNGAICDAVREGIDVSISVVGCNANYGKAPAVIVDVFKPGE